MKRKHYPVKLSGIRVKEFIQDMNSEDNISLDSYNMKLLKMAKKIVKKSK